MALQVRPSWRRAALDWLAPAIVVLIGVVDVALHPRSTQFPGSPALHVTFLAASAIALGYRRRAPILAPLLAVLIVTIWVSGMWPRDAQGPEEGFLILVGASYAIAAGNSGRRLLTGSILLVVYFAIGQTAMFLWGGGVGDSMPLIIWMVVAWFVGFLLNRRGQQIHQARGHASALLAEQELRTAEAVVHERSRIARELHDVVAHSLSVIVVQAAAERRAWRHGTADAASTDVVLDNVERTGREALVDLRRLLGLLREVNEPPTLMPQPSLDRLDELLEQARQAGLTLDIRIEGERFALPAGVDLSAYRIIQEALTNIIKHADAARAEVTVRYEQAGLRITITDDGCGPSSNGLTSIGAGHGLVGMRERASIFGGDLSAGRTPDGEWQVVATLPTSAPPITGSQQLTPVEAL
jgi:signal transduction histidine kinase